MRGENGVTAAIDKAKHIVLRDFLAEADAARAKNAALIVERDARPEHNVLRYLYLSFEETLLGRPVLDAEFLQETFAGLIANRTIERMIDEEELHHAALAFFRQRRICAHAHSLGDILRARNLWARHPIDYGFAVGAELRFAIGSESRHAHLNQTHPAIAGGAEFFVITITRHITAGLLARLDHARAFRELAPHAIDLDIEHGRCCRSLAHDNFVIVRVPVLMLMNERDRSRSRG